MALLVSIFTVFAPEALAVTYSGTFSSNMRWELDTITGKLDIYPVSGSTGVMQNFGSTSAPWYAYRTAIERVDIRQGITNIGNYAFNGCVNLRRLDASSVTSIGEYAFNGCVNIEYFFTTTETSNIRAVVTDGVKSIGNYAFNGCSSLIQINVSADVSSIGQNVFVGCRSLADIKVDVLNPNYMLLNCALQERNTSGEPVRVLKAQADIKDSDFYIASTVTAIDAEAFAYCSDLTKVTIPVSVNRIGLNAFSWCGSLKEATFMGNVPQYLPSGTLQLFSNAADGFVIYFYPHTSGWPTSASSNWRGYTAYAKVDYIVLNRTEIAVNVDGSASLQATVYPINSSQVVTWNSDNNPVATVTSNGLVVGVAPGVAIISATSTRVNGDTIIATCRVQVAAPNVAVTSLRLDKSQMALSVDGASDVLTAVVYPTDATNKALIWESSNTAVAGIDTGSGLYNEFQRLIVPISAGTATITVRTADRRFSASCAVTVTAALTFIPVSSITLATTTVAMGAKVDLNEISTVYPSNATNTTRSWDLVTELTTINGVSTEGGFLSVPWGYTGTVVVDAVVTNGLAERTDADGNTTWDFPENVDYTQRFTIRVVQFIPVAGIINGPSLAFVGVPLLLRGTVQPAGASYQSISWSMGDINTAAAYLSDTGVLLAQQPGVVSVVATINNGVLSGSVGVIYEQTFIIKVDPYVTNALDLRANPGGTVSGAGAGQFAGGEIVTISAMPSAGYTFAGWYTSNGGEFADANRATTQFTMPGNATAVTAYFSYIGLPGGTAESAGTWSGGVILPTPVHYFTNNSIYTKNSSVTFGHVTVRDFQLFSYVTLDGRTLSRNAHYTASRNGGYTEIILANGYLNALEQGAHTLTVYFSDYVSVTAVFTVISTAQTSRDYDDVYTSDWFYSSVAYVSDRGWMTAKPSEPRRFRPSDTVTQGEVIDALYRMAGSPTVMNMYGQALQGRDAAYEWVRANSILPLGGYYNLNSSITRQDIAVIFSRLVTVLRMRYPVVRTAASFADEWQIDPNARTAVNDIYRAGIMSGRTVNTFVPLGNVTRAEYAATLQRFSESVGV